MEFVIAPDSFKESLSATKVAFAISEGIKRVIPEAQITCIPLADGGEGTVDALVTATNGKIIQVPSFDALNRPIKSFYGILGDGKTAIIEMAAASGLELLAHEDRNPMITTTYGTGLLIKAAMESGFRNIVIGIGGSATNDGGAGMAQALGFKLQDKNGNQIGFGGGSLNQIHSIDDSDAHCLLPMTKFTVASDVRNPLLGASGATMIYGPQKGAAPEMLKILEKNLHHFSIILEHKTGRNISKIPGTGAAGGLGAGLMAFCNAEIISGFELISKMTDLEEKIKHASFVFTGEGKIDRQTAFGKTISGVAKLGKKYKVPVIALAGIIADDLTELYEQGVTSIYSISGESVGAEESKIRAAELLANMTEQIVRGIVQKK
jgi:glycerate kinase